MSTPDARPSDDLPDVLATGRGDVTTVVVSMTERHPEGRDEEYLAWHALDHRPEQHRLRGLRGHHRWVSTPACRAARAASDERYDAVDHVMAYLFADRDALGPFGALGASLWAGGRMPMRLPTVELGVYEPQDRVAAARTLVGADVIPWRPATGAYLLIEQGAGSAESLASVPGVAGVWSLAGTSARPLDDLDLTGHQLTCCFLDDDPVATAERLRPALMQRWEDSPAPALLAAPFHAAIDHDWGRHLP